ncbi:hypothetical protein NL676_026489 [Syzygium grande]|nr:hypothetical protein NL676_026489 [Syzygium grande]
MHLIHRDGEENGHGIFLCKKEVQRQTRLSTSLFLERGTCIVHGSSPRGPPPPQVHVTEAFVRYPHVKLGGAPTSSP